MLFKQVKLCKFTNKAIRKIYNLESTPVLSSNTRVVGRTGQGVAMRNFQGIEDRVHELSTGHTAQILCNSNQSNCGKSHHSSCALYRDNYVQM